MSCSNRISFLVTLLLATPAFAQHHSMQGMDHSTLDMGDMDMEMPMDHEHMMPGAFGDYSMTREASGTSWVPESSPMYGIMGEHGDWQTMVMGYADAVYNKQGGPRGDSLTYSDSMIMGMAQRPAGEGTFSLRAMGSLDALMGQEGYPLLLQTGETANGVDHLVDRQHPHDLFMELAATYSHPTGKDQSAFVYFGYPGEPALGPATFMHRFSGMVNPVAPITHHWLDSTHITFGVATGGYIWNDWKLEGSVFTGREPDRFRYNFDDATFDSQSLRLSWNPSKNWSLQVSRGWIDSPEELDPSIDQVRTTASAMYNLPLDDGDNLQTTLAWGRNNFNPGASRDAYLLESAYHFNERHTVFGRIERAQKDELFEAPDPLAGRSFTVNQFSAGYLYDMPVATRVKWGLGAMGTLYALPSDLDAAYGDNPASFLIFSRVSLY